MQKRKDIRAFQHNSTHHFLNSSAFVIKTHPQIVQARSQLVSSGRQGTQQHFFLSIGTWKQHSPLKLWISTPSAELLNAIKNRVVCCKYLPFQIALRHLVTSREQEKIIKIVPTTRKARKKQIQLLLHCILTCVKCPISSKLSMFGVTCT